MWNVNNDMDNVKTIMSAHKNYAKDGDLERDSVNYAKDGDLERESVKMSDKKPNRRVNVEGMEHSFAALKRSSRARRDGTLDV